MNESILLIEDDPADIELLSRALKQVELSAPLDVVRDGRRALDYLFCRGDYATRSEACLPGLILLDLNLPKVDGLEVLAQIQASERLQRVPVIVLSSSTQPEDLGQATELGILHYFVKPTTYSEYTDIASEIRRHWQRRAPQP